jgi:hypothetical protein
MAKATNKTDNQPVKMLRITAKRDGFRRAGIAHPGTATEHEASNFTDDQIEQLKTEPMLVVEEFETAPAAAEEEKK